MFKPPGKSYCGPLAELTDSEKLISNQVKQHVAELSEIIGERNFWQFDALEKTAKYIPEYFTSEGFEVLEQTYFVEKKLPCNIYIEIPGQNKPEQTLVIGAHYDSVFGSPGANDNASGVAALLELAKLLKNQTPNQNVILVAFTHEEPPLYRSNKMGSVVFAREIIQKKNITGMISLETIGYYSHEKKSQQYPFFLNFRYPETANFIGFVSNIKSRKFLYHCIKLFRKHAEFPSEGIAGPSLVQGISWSDQWSFWKEGIPAIMITDTAFYRYPYYHTEFDTAEKIDPDNIARVITGLAGMIRSL